MYPPSYSYPYLIPSRPVHARASNAECHAYPFCVRAIDARGKLSLLLVPRRSGFFVQRVSFDELWPWLRTNGIWHIIVDNSLQKTHKFLAVVVRIMVLVKKNQRIYAEIERNKTQS